MFWKRSVDNCGRREGTRSHFILYSTVFVASKRGNHCVPNREAEDPASFVLHGLPETIPESHSAMLLPPPATSESFSFALYWLRQILHLFVNENVHRMLDDGFSSTFLDLRRYTRYPMERMMNEMEMKSPYF